MSGGHFDYNQYEITNIAAILEQDIAKAEGHVHPATLVEMRKALRALHIAHTYAHRIDWFLSGDDGEQSFHDRLKEELAEVDLTYPAIDHTDVMPLIIGKLPNLETMEGVTVTFAGGPCPYQVQGTIDGIPFYFRARGAHWSLSIDPKDPLSDTPLWQKRQPFGDGPFSAGWMTDLEVEHAIGQAIYQFRAAQKA